MAPAGLDEAGRGALAGPVYAAAVILPAGGIPGLNDSKKLTALARTRLADAIRRDAIAWSVARAELEEIERLNIIGASLLAMQRAAMALQPAPGEALVDGLHLPVLPCAAKAVVGGDALHPCIMAASILAKVERDAEMCRLDRLHPGYGLALHKGYPTPAHKRALQTLGVSPAHRRGYAPVAQLLRRTSAEVCA